MMLEAQKGCVLGVGMIQNGVLSGGGLDVRIDLVLDGLAGLPDGIFHGVG
jgi:hypothetical protein